MKKGYLIWVLIALVVLIGGVTIAALIGSVIGFIVWWGACFVMNLIGHWGMYSDLGFDFGEIVKSIFIELLFAPIYLIFMIFTRLKYRN